MDVEERHGAGAQAVDPLLDDPRIGELGLLLEVAAGLVRTLGGDMEGTSGIGLGWYEVLLRLGRSPGRRLRMNELANEVAITSGGLTRLVDRIQEAGLVERASCPSDRRVIHVQLTDEGLRVLLAATAGHLDGIDRALAGGLDPQERVHLRGLLAKLRGPKESCGSPASAVASGLAPCGGHDADEGTC